MYIKASRMKQMYHTREEMKLNTIERPSSTEKSLSYEWKAKGLCFVWKNETQVEVNRMNE